MTTNSAASTIKFSTFSLSEDFVYNGAQSEGIDFDMYSGVNDDLLEISATNGIIVIIISTSSI